MVLHWLAARYYIQFKLDLLTHLAHTGQSPAYIRDATMLISQDLSHRWVHSAMYSLHVLIAMYLLKCYQWSGPSLDRAFHVTGFQTGNTDVQDAIRLHVVVCLGRMQVGPWGQSPSPLVWHHHTHHTLVQNSSGWQVVWCCWTVALEQAACFTVVIWQSRPVQKTYLFLRTRLQRLVTLAFRHQT